MKKTPRSNALPNTASPDILTPKPRSAGMGLGLRQGEGLEVVLEVRLKVVDSLSQHCKAEGYVYPRD
jgi:hypothetical protein